MANSRNALDFQDPGTMREELLSVPGFVNELKDHTLAVSPRPNPPLAFAGALAMLAHLTGRSYVDERGSHTNLYLAALAPTAMGKEDPRDTNKKLAAAAGILPSVPDTPASGEGLEDAVAASPSLLLQTDEADALLTAMRGNDSRASKMNEMVLRFFSEAKSAHAMRLKAGMTTAPIIPLPHLTLFATGIPQFVYGALTAKALDSRNETPLAEIASSGKSSFPMQNLASTGIFGLSGSTPRAGGMRPHSQLSVRSPS